MLALFQLWPMVFGHRAPMDAAPAAIAEVVPKRVEAVAMTDTLPRMTPAAVSLPALKSCYRQYRAKFQQCPASDRACRTKMADQWDLCEATGLWPQ